MEALVRQYVFGATTEIGRTLATNVKVDRYFVGTNHLLTIAVKASQLLPCLPMFFAMMGKVIGDAFTKITQVVSCSKFTTKFMGN